MKQTGIFLLLLIVLVACKKIRNQLNEETEVKFATTCLDNIIRAQEDLKKGLLVDYSSGRVERESIMEYVQLMKEAYNIDVQYGEICFTFGGEDCYRAIMDSAIIARYGNHIFE